MDPVNVANQVVAGVLTGLVYGLMALGLSVIFGVVRVVNFAHGEMMTIAMYATVVPVRRPRARSVPRDRAGGGRVLRVRVRAAGGAHQPVHHPPRAFAVHAAGRGRDHHGERAPDDLRPGRAERQLDYLLESIELGPLLLDRGKLYGAIVACVTSGLLFAFFKFTRDRHGDPRVRRQLPRRESGGPEREALLRLHVRGRRRMRRRGRMHDVPPRRRTPALGPAYTLLAFVIVIVGGLGSMGGALLGGVLIGVSEALAGLFIAPSAKSMFSFGLLILVLLFRPQGLLGKRA